MEDDDIRWQQRFSNYKKALIKLLEATEKPDLNELEEEGMIQHFEYSYELAWKTLQDLLHEKGYHNVNGANAVLIQAIQDGYIEDRQGWQKMKKSRELTSHTYDSETADGIAEAIVKTYAELLKLLKKDLKAKELQDNYKNMRFGLDENEWDGIIKTFANNKNVEEAILFGSRAMGSEKLGSDVDIAAKGHDLNLDSLVNLMLELENLDILLKFDLVNFNDIKSPDLLEHINRVGIPIYQKNKNIH